MRFFALILTFIFLKLNSAFAIPETGYREAFAGTVQPWIQAQGVTFEFMGAEKQTLHGIRFQHPVAEPGPGTPPSKGTIVVLPGRSEPYLKYSEVFYDLFQQGYDVFSYDHRGQGLSPHLSRHNVQIGHVDHFMNYVRDLRTFTDTVLATQGRGPFFLLAHSMGGGIAARYLIENPGKYTRAALSAPMLELDTSPYSRGIAKLIVTLATMVGLGNRYAIGYGDYVEDAPFSENAVTHSADRAWMYDQISKQYPETQVGGPSNKWVLKAMNESRRTSQKMSGLQTPTLILQAGQDTYVKPGAQTQGCAVAADCHLVKFENAKHEILMESDATRDAAFVEIYKQFR